MARETFMKLFLQKNGLIFIAAVVFLAGGIYLTGGSLKSLLFPEKTENIKVVQANAKQAVQSLKEEPFYSAQPKQGEKIGELFIPKLHASMPIYEGTDEDELAKGVGHFAESVLPGVKDNCVLSGHRDTVFRKLGEVRENDLLITETSAGTFTYKVNKVRIVQQNDRTVIVPKPRATLTLTTCYPFHYIGNAPKRYVLVATLISESLNEKRTHHEKKAG
jgi:sortase A